MFSGFNGSCICTTTKSKSIYKKMTKQELTDRLIALEERLNNYISEKMRKETEPFTEMMTKYLENSSKNNEFELKLYKLVDDKIQEHINSFHNGGKK